MTRDGKPDLDAAYALGGVEANRKLYADWAETYDSDFAGDMDYLLPDHVADAFVRADRVGPVLDLGAGTGLVGQALAQRGIAPVDGTDLSQDMLDRAAQKSVYRRLFSGDMTDRLPVDAGSYNGIVCAGTFTHGHVGPEALPEVLRCLAPGGTAVLSVNAAHFEKTGFAAAFAALRSDTVVEWQDVPIYGPRAKGAHRLDRALIVTMKKSRETQAP